VRSEDERGARFTGIAPEHIMPYQILAERRGPPLFPSEIVMVDAPPPTDGPVDPRVYMAAERTLLAWVRTGLSMMGFGFVVARFGLFLRELAVLPENTSRPSVFSLWVGTTLVILGVAVNVASAFNHWRTLRRLEQGQPLRATFWSLGTAVALVLGLIGLFMAGYLIVGLDR
jgi:putative membrane protein